MDARHHSALRGLEDSVHQFCGSMVSHPLKGSTLIIAGRNGSGKTHAAKAILEWVCQFSTYVKMPQVGNHIPSFDAAFCYWPTLLDQLKDGEWKRVDGLIEARVLILDDLGAGHDPSLVGVDKLCRILSERESKWTVITTNTPPDKWGETFDRRITSRFFRNSEIVDLSDVPDFGLL